VAGPDALSAEDALIAVKYYQRVAGVNTKFPAYIIETPVSQFEMLTGGDLLQLAIPVFCTVPAVQQMVA
jgi:hypothetical protein